MDDNNLTRLASLSGAASTALGSLASLLMLRNSLRGRGSVLADKTLGKMRGELQNRAPLLKDKDILPSQAVTDRMYSEFFKKPTLGR